MKHLLSLLMIFVLLHTQAQALSGGPDFGTDTTGAGVGTFAGVLLPESDQSTSGLTNSTSNSLGVFAIVAPSTGLSTGAFTYFDSGATYVGSITGIIDPKDLSFNALVRATFNFSQQFSFSDTNSTTDIIFLAGPSGYANGSINGKLKSEGGGFLNNSLAIRIEGDANLDVQAADPNTATPFGPVRSLKLRVDGFKQSTDTTGLITAAALSGNTGTTSN